MIEPIRVQGLREFQRSLRQMDSALPRGLRLAGNRAAQIVVDEAKPRVPRRSGKAAGSIKVASTAKAVRVSAGSKRVPYYPWLDFGGRVGPEGSVRRPFLKQGRYLWKAYADNDQRVQDELGLALADVARSAGLEVTE